MKLPFAQNVLEFDDIGDGLPYDIKIFWVRIFDSFSFVK